MAYWTTDAQTIPFDDSERQVSNSTAQTTDGVDTTIIDGYRQGVELKTAKHFFLTTQPKIWAGRIKSNGEVSHEMEQTTYGQTTSFSEFFGNPKFDDRIIIFDPVLYVNLGGNYPFPIIFNDGPQQAEENIVEPLTIPFRKENNESVKYVVKGVHGSLEEGSEDKFAEGAEPISEFIKFNVTTCRQFLDEGEKRIGETFAGSIMVPGYVSSQKSLPVAFEDKASERVAENISAFYEQNSPMKNLLSNMGGYREGNSIIPSGCKSATAGTDCYGPQQARFGTDSLAFRGRLRGS